MAQGFNEKGDSGAGFPVLMTGCKRPLNCETCSSFFPVINEGNDKKTSITYLKWLKKIVDCMLPYVRDDIKRF